MKALCLVDLERAGHRPRHSGIYFHDKYFVGVHIDRKIYAEHPSKYLFFINILSKSFGEGEYFPSHFFPDLFVLKVVVYLLVAARPRTLFSQFRMTDNLAMQRTN